VQEVGWPAVRRGDGPQPEAVIAQLTAMDPEITPEMVATSWALLKPFHDKVGYTACQVK
jgi:hypothetical protein